MPPNATPSMAPRRPKPRRLTTATAPPLPGGRLFPRSRSVSGRAVERRPVPQLERRPERAERGRAKRFAGEQLEEVGARTAPAGARNSENRTGIGHPPLSPAPSPLAPNWLDIVQRGPSKAVCQGRGYSPIRDRRTTPLERRLAAIRVMWRRPLKFLERPISPGAALLRTTIPRRRRRPLPSRSSRSRTAQGIALWRALLR